MRLIGVDGTGVPMAGKPDDTGVVVVVNLEDGTGLWVEAVDERDAGALQSLLTQVLTHVQPAEVVTDEGVAYPEALEGATAAAGREVAHSLCAAHFRRNKISRLRHLLNRAEKNDWGLVKMELKALEALLRSPPEVWGGFAYRLLRLVQNARPPEKGKLASWHYRLKLLLLELSRKAPKVRGITNNRTEQLIGRAFKVRTKSMRGFKRTDNRLRFLQLALAVDARAQREGAIYLI